MFHDMYGHGWGMGWGWIIGLIVLVVIIWIVVKALNQNKTSDQPGNKTPLDILKERYARGEIDKQEFEERKKDL
jgi:putative membrane protein